MAITQERVYKIVQAGQHYQWLWREVKRLSLQLAQGEVSQDSYWEGVATLLELPEHAEVLTAEALHYKFTRHRNNYSKAKMAERRALARGEVVAEKLQPARPYNLQSPAEKRQTSDNTPATPTWDIFNDV